MKTRLLFTGIFLFCSSVNAQQNFSTNSTQTLRIKTISAFVNKPHQLVKKLAGGPFEAQPSLNSSALKSVSHPRITPAHRNGAVNHVLVPLIPETIIGTSTYDLQTNGTISNRVVNNSGKISATWTMSLTGTTATVWPDRGTGYNYSSNGGLNWQPAPIARVEGIRTGFQNVACAGFEELILAHTATVGAGGIIPSWSATQGSGTWSAPGSIPNTVEGVDWWPKAAVGGDGHSFHAIWQGTGTASGPMYYSRYVDGANWEPKTELPGMIYGTDIFAVSADMYSIDVKDSVVAIVIGDFGTDVTLLKSTDNGVTWTKRIIDQYPIPLYDGLTMNTDIDADGIEDTLWSGASDATVLIDNNNLVHVFYGRTRSLEAPGGTGLSYFQTQNIAYWNESMADNDPKELGGIPDIDGNGVIDVPLGCGGDTLENPMGYYGTGLVAFVLMPKAGVDANNNIYLTYMATDEKSDTSIYNQMFMHPYIIKSVDGGLHWTNPTDSAYDALLASQPVDGESYDGAYPCIARNVDTHVHMTYQRDFAPGTTLSGTNFPCEFGNNADGSNDEVYVGIPVNDIPTGTFIPPSFRAQPNAIATITTPSFSISPNYPNPFRGTTSVNINLKKAAEVTVEISDLLGRVLSVQKYPNFNAVSHKLTIDATTFASGVYMYKVKSGNDTVTKKMIVQ